MHFSEEFRNKAKKNTEQELPQTGSSLPEHVKIKQIIFNDPKYGLTKNSKNTQPTPIYSKAKELSDSSQKNTTDSIPQKKITFRKSLLRGKKLKLTIEEESPAPDLKLVGNFVEVPPESWIMATEDGQWFFGQAGVPTTSPDRARFWTTKKTAINYWQNFSWICHKYNIIQRKDVIDD